MATGERKETAAVRDHPKTQEDDETLLQQQEASTVDQTSVDLQFEPPTFDDAQEETVELDAKEELKLKCRFKSAVLPEITTSLNDQPLSPHFFTTSVDANEVVLRRPQATKADGGTFRVTLRTQFGEASKEIHVVVHDVPDAPEDLRIVSFGGDFVKLEWRPPASDGGSPIKIFRIEAKQENRRTFRRAGQVDADERSFVVADLEQNTRYEFRVAAINKFGGGEWATTQLATSSQSSPPVVSAPPTIVEFNENLCLLEWAECAESGGSPIHSYDVYMREDGGECVKLNEDEVFCTKFAIRRLIKAGHSYAFKIEARNEAGLESCSDLFTEARQCPAAPNYSLTILPPPIVSLVDEQQALVKVQELPEAVESTTVFFRNADGDSWNKRTADGAEVTVPDLKEELSYVFKVEARTADGLLHKSEETEPILIGGQKKPKITKALKNVEVPEKKPLQLECHALGEPVLEFVWTRDAQELGADTCISICNESNSSVLKIDRVRPQDEGVYTCRVSNAGGSAESSARVEVVEVEAFFAATFPEELDAVEGGEIRLKCSLSDADAVVQWIRNGIALEAADGPQVEILAADAERELVLRNVRPADAGEFACVLPDGQKARCRVVVREPEVHVAVGPQDQTIAAHHQTVGLVCELTRAAEVQWLKNGVQLSLNSAKYRVVNDGAKSSLEIRDFGPRDVGEYTCRLPNDELSAPARLDLRVPAEIRIADEFADVEVDAGGDLCVDFELHGFPTPQLDGDLNGTPLAELLFTQQSEEDERTSIRIRSMRAENAGELRLRATNASGADEKTLRIRVRDVPAPPQDVAVRLVGANGAEISWSPPVDEHQPVEEFVVERRSALLNRWRQCGVVAANEPLQLAVEELPLDEIVNFRVVAVNSIGRSKPSATVDLTTKSVSESASPPPTPPAQDEDEAEEPFEAPHLQRARGGGVKLTWKAVERVQLYAIERRKAGEKIWMRIGQTSALSFVDTTMRSPAGCSYRVVAQFANNRLRVSESTDGNEDTDEKTTPPKQQQPLQSAEKSELLEGELVDELATSSLPTASNSAGVSIELPAIEVAALQTTQIDDDSVRLQWTAPLQPNFKGFVVERFSNSFGKWEAVARCSAPTATIGGLSRTEAHRFRVAAESTDGSFGRFVEADAVRLAVGGRRAGDPEQKRRRLPQIDELDSTVVDGAVELSWEAGDWPCSFIVEGCRVDDAESEGEWLPMAQTTDGRALLRDLDAATDWKFRVVAESANGEQSEPAVSRLVRLPPRGR
ncbi:Twitchin [Aphelenchoides fujianensis]|nr:Twitchin [Aphelenchoides fujianensis]